jgi:hypothetical protein
MDDRTIIKFNILIGILIILSISVSFIQISLDAAYFLILFISAFEAFLLIYISSKFLKSNQRINKNFVISEDAISREIKMIKNAIEGSLISRKMLSYKLKDILETNRGIKLSSENAHNFINDRDIVALIFPDEYPDYFRNKDEYLNALNKFILMFKNLI